MSLLKPASHLRESNKMDKHDRILEAAYQLFLERGFDKVSIQEIATRAGVAKGTFYLYFRDKEALKKRLVAQKSNEFFQQALRALYQTDITGFEDKIIFIIDYVIDILAQNKDILRLITKDLSTGVFDPKMTDLFSEEYADVLQLLIAAAEESNVKLKNPHILLYMIVELASSTCMTCILYNEPLELAVFKPHLFKAIRQLIEAEKE